MKNKQANHNQINQRTQHMWRNPFNCVLGLCWLPCNIDNFLAATLFWKIKLTATALYKGILVSHKPPTGQWSQDFTTDTL